MSRCEPFYGVETAAAGVTSWNGDIGPAVTASTSDLPNASTVGGATTTDALDLLAATVAGLVIIDSAAKLEAAFPAVLGVHTVNLQTFWVSQSGAPIALPPGNSIVIAHPGTITGLGGAKVLILGDVAGRLVSGELVMNSIALLNMNPAGSDFLAESLAGRAVVVTQTISLGQNAGTVQNCLGLSDFQITMRPSAPGATGVVIDGTNGVMLWNAASNPPGTVPYTGWTIAATCIIGVELRFDGCAFFGTPAGDSMLFIDPAALLPVGTLPTNIFGFEIFGCTVKGGAAMFGAGGLDQTDIRILSGGNVGGPSSQFIGDAQAGDPLVDAVVPLTQTYIASNTWEVVPSDNGPAAPPDDLTLTLVTPISQRHTVLITSRQVWSMRYDGPEDQRVSAVSWSATADRSGGSASVVDAQLEFNAGSGWTELPATRDTITLLSGTTLKMSGRTILSSTDNGFELRLVSRTSNNATDTDWHSFDVAKGI